MARRDKKAFLSDQCKEIEENSRMGNTRDFFKKSRDTKGTFHAQMGTIKDRNSMDLAEAEDTKNKARWFVNGHIIEASVFLKLSKISLIDIVILVKDQKEKVQNSFQFR